MNGWIKIHRDIMKHNLWEEKPFSKGQAWIDMILMANCSDGKVERGSFSTTESELSTRWGWTRKKVQLFLKYLENEEMVAKKSSNKGTIIKIVNYEIYQFREKQDNKKRKNRKESFKGGNKFNNFESRNYDFDSLEKDLLGEEDGNKSKTQL